MKFYTTERVSPKIGKTPEGFLVCYSVPVARTGEMIYNKAEADMMPWLSDFGADPDGNVIILREDSEVFRPETLESLQGKPVTIDHPEDLVNPDNWKELAKGTAQNIRRGEREESDLILADLLITDEEAIRYVESGELRQISVGYDADYEHLGDGRGRQQNIIGNHIALVQRGRAGIRCQIMDSKPCTNCGECKCHEDKKEAAPMKFKDTAFYKGLKKFLDSAEEEEVKEDEKKEETKDGEPEWAGELKKSLDGLKMSLDCFGKKTKDEDEEKEEKKTEDSDEEEEKEKKTEDSDDEDEDDKKKGTEDKKKSKDSAFFKDALSRSEILKPGYKPTGKTSDAVKREVLAQLYTTDDGKALIEPFLGKDVDFSKVARPTLDAAFIAVSELQSQRNNGRFTTDFRSQSNTTDSPADLNKKYAAFWHKKEGR